ncbi:CLIP domain-containing serine protease B15-like [Topomyia yanbarensis]|uniref:CLIP domain-containing serine protease B15-like n=1 Tax=Topomyia yanbarensis TaxID=2498891 RepID=UPI00273B806B|nr:CLIP domain-containing serine protease B15-like [Topomyia yanbarensis]
MISLQPLEFLLFVLLFRTVSSSQHNPQQCGIPKIDGNELIVHGQATSPGDWPWHVALYHRKGRSVEYACGGTIINDQYVLTAAHCVMNIANGFQLAPNRIFVRMGIHDLESFDPKSAQQHEVGKIHKFENFTRLIDDIALLELSTIIRFNPYVQPACVNLEPNITGELGTVVGWGLTEDDVTSVTLKQAEMPVIDPLTCLRSDRVLFGQTLNEGLFCAGYTNGTSVCNGDSGGGLFFRRANTWFLGGIVSFSQTRSGGTNYCYTKGYGAFTQVQKYLSWMREITKMPLVSDSDVRVCKPEVPDPAKTYPNYLPRQCGVYIPNRILGGQNARVFEFPWMVILQTDEKNFLCSGTLINKRYILTAAQCIKNDLPTKAILGEHTIEQDTDCNGTEDCAPPVRQYKIECVITHPDYSWRSKQNDIALIRLSEDVSCDDHVHPICLPYTEELRRYEPSRYIVTGWGITDPANPEISNILQKATIFPVNLTGCQDWLKNLSNALVLHDGQLCAAGREPNLSDTCAGDSGAPLGYGAKLFGTRFVQFGIVSYGVSCGTEAPAVYTNISYHMDWIFANMKP